QDSTRLKLLPERLAIAEKFAGVRYWLILTKASIILKVGSGVRCLLSLPSLSPPAIAITPTEIISRVNSLNQSSHY
ncbi:hypothetical protein, partial [Microcystis sp. M49636_WE2]|uniref:hypothetical protein n=1 Tax=Microcystis sp. M49636_WE2 TaxID=3030679 RepID=UPI00258FBB99